MPEFLMELCSLLAHRLPRLRGWGTLLGTGFLFLKLMGLRFTVFVGGLVLLEQGWNRTLYLMRA